VQPGSGAGGALPPGRAARLSGMSPAVDLEIAGNCSERPSAAAVAEELGTFADTVEAAWARPLVLYIGDDWEREYPTRERLDRPLWHRRFLRRPNVDGWSIWQIHGYAKVEGIIGGVDLNIMRATDNEAH
jgi:lysozyme